MSADEVIHLVSSHRVIGSVTALRGATAIIGGSQSLSVNYKVKHDEQSHSSFDIRWLRGRNAIVHLASPCIRAENEATHLAASNHLSDYISRSVNGALVHERVGRRGRSD